MPTAPPRHNAHQVKAKRKATQAHYNKHKRLNDEFYNSTAWRKVRASYVKQNPFCVKCRDLGRATPVDVVDHIVEIKDGGERLSYSNLQSLCHAHHNIKTSQARVGRVKSL